LCCLDSDPVHVFAVEALTFLPLTDKERANAMEIKPNRPTTPPAVQAWLFGTDAALVEEVLVDGACMILAKDRCE